MEIFANKVLLSAVIGWIVAQGTKVIIEIIRGDFHSITRLVGQGGMPSAHSATVVSMAVATYFVEGPSSTEFAIALLLAIIVIYDTRGVRFETGLQAKALNILMHRDVEEEKEPIMDKELNEKMGHTIEQILVGSVLGAITATVICRYM